MNAIQDPAAATDSAAGAAVDVEAIAAENAQLRAQLLAENEKLRQALADSRAASVQVQGLTDEDVRRLEHPEEFVQAENEQMQAKIAELQTKYNQVIEAVNAHQLDPTTIVGGLSDSDLQAELDRRHAAGQ